jgi:hypothetical protein
MHRTKVYSIEINPKGPTLKKFPDIKKKKKKNQKINFYYAVHI